MTEQIREKVNILLPLYHPNKQWLKEQLKSLNEQTYPNLSLIIVDDGPDMPVGKDFVSEYITKISFSYKVHDNNMGSNRTFEELVKLADGEYIAFCDQDDIWHKEKISKLYSAIKEKEATVAYCGLSAIGPKGDYLAEDIRQIRKRDIFLSGVNIAEKLVIKNCIYGSSLVMRTDIAKESLPLPVATGFDHWFTLWAAIKGEIVRVNEILVQHRIHDENQSLPLRGIETKDDYIEQRVKNLQIRMDSCLTRFMNEDNREVFLDVIDTAQKSLEWANARECWLKGDKKAFKSFYRGKALSPKAFWFELIMPLIPNRLFKRAIELIQ